MDVFVNLEQHLVNLEFALGTFVKSMNHLLKEEIVQVKKSLKAVIAIIMINAKLEYANLILALYLMYIAIRNK